MRVKCSNFNIKCEEELLAIKESLDIKTIKELYAKTITTPRIYILIATIFNFNGKYPIEIKGHIHYTVIC